MKDLPLLNVWKKNQKYYFSLNNRYSKISADKDLESSQDPALSVSRDSESERRVATPTATESQLPWKRNDNGDDDEAGIQQNEFPAWVSNKEYLAYNSPSATFLGKFCKCKCYSTKAFD